MGLLFRRDDEYENDNNYNNQFKSVILIHTISNWVVKSLNLRKSLLIREGVIMLTSNYILNKFNTNKLATCKYVSEKENALGIFLVSDLLWLVTWSLSKIDFRAPVYLATPRRRTATTRLTTARTATNNNNKAVW